MVNVTTDDRSNVAISKTVSTSGEAVTVRYRIYPQGATAGRVRLVEYFSEPVARSAVTFSDQDDGRWEYRSEEKVAFVGDLSGSDPVVATLEIRSASVDAGDCLSTVIDVSEGTSDPRHGTNGSESDTEVVADGNGNRSSANGGVSTNGVGTGTVEAGAGVQSVVRSDPDEAYDRPAVGVIATDDNAGAVARTTLQATERDLQVFVAVDGGRDATAATLARRLGATVVEPGLADAGDDELATALAVAARDRAYPGVILQGECREPMAFDESLAAFEADAETVVEAVPEATETDVLAALPAYNEADTVGRVVERAREHADEVLVVDDGSTDGTAARARQSGATVVEKDRNRGYGHALKTIFEEADGRDVDHLVVLDADDQHDPADISRLVAKQRESGAELVIGNRFDDATDTDAPLYRRFGLRVITLMVNLSMGSIGRESRIRDTQSGFRAYDATAVASLADDADAIDDRMSASIDILYHARANHFAVEEVPTTISYDVSNANTRNPVAHGMTIVNNVLKTLERKRPVTVLGIPGFLLAMSGAAIGYWTVSQFLITRDFQVGFAILSALLVFAGFLSSFTSVILHSLNTHFDDVT